MRPNSRVGHGLWPARHRDNTRRASYDSGISQEAIDSMMDLERFRRVNLFS